MIKLKQKQAIIMHHLQGVSNREIARMLGINKNTVNTYVNDYEKQRRTLLGEDETISKEEVISAFLEKPKYNTSNRGPIKVTREVDDIILYCLKENQRKRACGLRKQQMRIIDIHEYVCRQGHDISYTSVKRAVRRLKELTKEAFIKQEYEPGQVCEFDWGEVKLDIGGTGMKRYQMALFATANGNYRYARLYPAQDTAAFMESHVDFFEHCGGVYHEMVYDNMKVAVKKFVGINEKEPTEALLTLSSYYGFSFRFCNVASGNEKGHVERSVEYVRRKAFSAPGHDNFETLLDANLHLEQMCDRLNNTSGADGRNHALVFATEEKPCLLPVVPRLECSVRQGATVDKYGTISFRDSHYSVSDVLVGQKVIVKAYTNTLSIYKDGSKLAEHIRSYKKGEWVIDINHYLKTLKRKPGALARSTAILQADTQTKEIYDHYYTQNPKGFIEILPIIREKGAQCVKEAIENLEKLTVSDKSADKVLALCSGGNLDYLNASEDRISLFTKASLASYNILMKVQNPAESVSV